MTKASDVIAALAGKTLATAESCTGGMIGAALTAVSGASSVYKGGVVSYCDEIKNRILGVDAALLKHYGAVSQPVAQAMAAGARKVMNTDYAVSVTGLAGPGGDDRGNSVGTVFIGFADADSAIAREYHFDGDRHSIRQQALDAALELIMKSI